MIYSDASQKQIEEIAAEFPSTLVVMIYDDALDGLETVIAAIETGDIARRYEASVRVSDMLGHLCLALDLEAGGEIAQNLAALYKHGIQQMTEINFTNDAGIARALIRILEPLRDSWVELDERIHADVEQAEAMNLDSLRAPNATATATFTSAAA